MEMAAVHVVGIGLDGVAGLSAATRERVEQARLLVGSRRHLGYFPAFQGERLLLEDWGAAIAHLQSQIQQDNRNIVILASGDPLFFGLGRLLLEKLPAEQLQFHPHVSSVQLAFSRIPVSWQDAQIISAHGRSLEELIKALQRGTEKIAVLTDGTNSPGAIAKLLRSLDLPSYYQLWVCENLGSPEERVRSWAGEDITTLAAAPANEFAPLNVVILLRQSQTHKHPFDPATLPLFGLPDAAFHSFSDRPGLMTKREIRLLVLGQLALRPGQIVWDIGAGTGSVAIEIARLCPTSQIYAIEKTAAGLALIEQNCQRFHTPNIQIVPGTAPDSLKTLPAPDRIFIGGSSGNLPAILDQCSQYLASDGVIVLALATLEHLTLALDWFRQHNQIRESAAWDYRLLQAQISRSVPVGPLTRLAPLNPVTLITATPPPRS